MSNSIRFILFFKCTKRRA